MSLEDRDGEIWLDGEFMPWREAKVHSLNHTLHYGVGVFEGVRAYSTSRGPAIFRLNEHTDRLYNSAHILNMQIPYAKDELLQVQQEVIRRNKLDAAYIRPMVFYGGEHLGLNPKPLSTHVVVAAWEWGAYLGEENLTRGIKVRTSSFTRTPVNSILCKAKANGNYINSILALQEALDCGCDEALMLDSNGLVAEGSGENIFIVRKGKIYTPDLTAVLEGITRDTIFTLAAEFGYTIQERPITRDEVYICDEAFFTGTAAEVTPIRELDGRTIGSGGRGPITEKLQTAYLQLVRGESENHSDWLTLV